MKKIDLFFAFILLPVDFAMIIAAFVFAYYLRIDLEVVPAFSDIGLREYLRYSLYLMPAWIALLALNGLYNIRSKNGLLRELYQITVSSSTAMIILIMSLFLSKTDFFSRLILIFTWVASIILIFLGRVIIRTVQSYLLQYGIGRKNIILIGDNSTSANITEHLLRYKRNFYKIYGVLNGANEKSKHGLKILGSIESVKEKIIQLKIDEVVLTDIDLAKSKILKIIKICSDYKVTFKYVPDTFSLMTLNVSPETIGTMPVMELKPIPLDGWGRITKRVFDFLISFLILVVTSPIMLVISILIKISSSGPVIYSHERIGRDEKKFKCHKFRSMYHQSEKKEKKYWTTANDNRVTPLGNILRKTNLDELPQFWNILVGDMSLVGPRPEQSRFVQKFESEIPEYFKRHRVKAGLTGWAQVNGLKGDTSIRERVRYDIYYIENWSLWFDAKIILKTIWILIYETFAGKFEYRSCP